jgi:hypothetical protein
MDTLADEILRWDKETRAILLSIKRIVKYFGTDEEYEWIVAVLSLRGRASCVSGSGIARGDGAGHGPQVQV